MHFRVREHVDRREGSKAGGVREALQRRGEVSARMRMLELFAGELGWARAFLARGWKATMVDLVEPSVIPGGCTFLKADVMRVWATSGGWIHINDEFACI